MWSVDSIAAIDRSRHLMVHLDELKALHVQKESHFCALEHALKFMTALRELTVSCGGKVQLPVSLVLQLATTCHQLQRVELESWQRVEGEDEAVDEAFAALAEYNPFLEEMRVHTCACIGDRTLTALATRCPRFQSLRVDAGLQLTDASLLVLVRGCPLLATVHALGDGKRSRRSCCITEAGLRAAVTEQQGALLESLRLHNVHNIDQATRVWVQKQCPKLMVLKVTVVDRYSS